MSDNTFDSTLVSAMTMSFEEIQALITKLESQNDPENQEMIEALKGITPEMLEMTPAQKRLQALAAKFEEVGVDTEQSIQAIEGIAQESLTKATQQIVESMDDEGKSMWDTFVDSGANQMQKLEMLNAVSVRTLGQKFDDIYTDVVNKLVDEIEAGIDEQKALADGVKGLSEEDAAKANKLMQDGNAAEALQIIFGNK